MKKIQEENLVFVAYITLKNGRRIYARQYGKKAFCLCKNSKEKKD